MRIAIETPRHRDVQVLLRAHMQDMQMHSPPESVHTLDLESLCAPEMRFLTARNVSGQLMGCGALRDLDNGTGEIKSMRTAGEFRRLGVAKALLTVIIEAACASGFSALYLETGTPAAFAAARSLYLNNGFAPCSAFGAYPSDDPYSVCMVLHLA